MLWSRYLRQQVSIKYLVKFWFLRVVFKKRCERLRYFWTFFNLICKILKKKIYKRLLLHTNWIINWKGGCEIFGLLLCLIIPLFTNSQNSYLIKYKSQNSPIIIKITTIVLSIVASNQDISLQKLSLSFKKIIVDNTYLY